MTGIRAALNRQIGIEEYLIWSTVMAVLMFVSLRGSFQAGYVIVLLNALVLLVFDHLAIHRNHMAAILALAGFSVIGADLAGTPFTAIIAQIVGITIMSVYFLCALTSFGLSLTRWMELYMRVAFAMALFGLVTWPVVTLLSGDARLRAIYSEPSFFIYVTLPAVGYCVNCYVTNRRYGLESLIFLASYILADSSLGFLGLLLIGLLAYGPRLKGRQLVGAMASACILLVGVYAASANVRFRVNDLAKAVVNQDLSQSGATTFAFLSNIYVTSQSFLAHPLTGIGIGGYANAYDKYVGNITDTAEMIGQGYLTSLQLNRDDAASMFLRTTAELGILGPLFLIAFLVVCARVRGAPYLTIRNALLPYLIVRMTRLGAYFTVELYFFVGIYLLNYLNYLQASRPSLPLSGTPIESNPI